MPPVPAPGPFGAELGRRGQRVAVRTVQHPGEQSYAAAGRYYAASGDLTPGNPYAGWIAQCTAGQVDELVAGILAAIAVTGPASRARQELLGVYERSARLDGQFWEMAGRPEGG